MLIDETYITVQAGNGGDGAVTFFPGKSGPSGGDGGKGANVYVKTNRSLTSLYNFTKKHLFIAEKGGNGETFQKTGHNGEDLVLEFPVGTELTEDKTGKRLELPDDGRAILVCSGGRGGYGNEHFKSATNQVPRHAEKGFPGERRSFKVVMRLIAEFGLIGLPNAGKSSLLNELTKAQAKIAPYPFTTLEPNLGALGEIIIADIPGLIEGAHTGRGLGIKFLKHVEKVKLLIHCISLEDDLVSMEKNYEAVRHELASFNGELLKKPVLILLTKSDLVDEKARKEKIDFFKKEYGESLVVSIHDWDALELLKKKLLAFHAQH